MIAIITVLKKEKGNLVKQATDKMTDEDVKIYKASKELQMKAGTGQVDAETISKAEKAIEETSIDFAPMAKRHLDDLQQALDKTKKGELDKDTLHEMVTRPVMSLKSEGAMFSYNLVGDLANIMLSFLESVNEVDKTVLQILQAHHTTLNAVVNNKMKGDGGPTGNSLKTELRQAIQRYHQQKRKS